MDASPVISARAAAKVYRLWASPAARLRRPLLQAAGRLVPTGTAWHQSLVRATAGCCRDFRALDPISFDIHRGEAVGIIGRNGSGKSTLLQLIAGILQPSSGSISTHGRISALLELGSGFNPDFTGRENVYLNGAILGLTRPEIDALLPAILEFADIGDFIDEPVKTYSSGMMMRLAFAVAVAVQPDILIVDEALSVGDVFFTQKCFARIREILANGATLIFVSHDTAAVQNLCTRGLLLHQGRLVHDGPPEECVSRYFGLHQSSAATSSAAHLRAGTHPAIDPAASLLLQQHDLVRRARSRHGDRLLEVLAATVLDSHGHATLDFEMLQRATIRLHLRAAAPIARPSIGIQVHDRMSNLLFAGGTAQLHFPLPPLGGGEEIMLDFRLGLSLQAGDYTLSLDAAEHDPADPNVGTFHDRIGGLGPLRVAPHRGAIQPFYGMAQLPLEITYA